MNVTLQLVGTLKVHNVPFLEVKIPNQCYNVVVEDYLSTQWPYDN